MRKLLALLLLPLLLTGCGSDVIADRVYAQAVALSQQNGLRLSLQRFDEEGCHTVRADSLAEAFRLEEARAGGRVFVGHTELICLDGSVTASTVRELFYENGISPACKLLYAPSGFLQDKDSTPVVHTLRMAERGGLLTETNLATCMEEWLGAYKTALLPAPGEPLPGLLLLHENGTCTRLHEDAARGMLWLRRPPEQADVTVGSQEITLQDIRLEKRMDGEQPVYTLHVSARGCDAAARVALEQQLRRDCEAAARLVRAQNADVIGLQTLCEAENCPLPEVLPLVQVCVIVGA